MINFRDYINSTQDELIEAIKNDGYNMVPDMRDKEGNHFLMVGKEKEVIFLALMIKKEDADNREIDGIKEFYIEDLAAVFKVGVMNGGGSSPIFKQW